ncbi:MAG TPA: 2-oxoglutarate dehydrogenase complex dihydrolipoyllysine-residue succinyltransferase [Tepidisphaeraceae bacterium]|nr:2-oxoglutarate dehydrogenase complex dihydrolipoyllysine-residue succinyltransferase [Tepidisphaeraceae bacterium]
MSTNVEIPSLGESVSEAVLLRWIKNDGDVVSAGDPLAELETDKANVDLPAPVAGVVRHVKEAGETVQIGETVARIDAAPAGGAPAPSPGGNASKPAAAPAKGGSSSPPPLPPAQPQTTPAKDTGTSAFVPSGGGHAAPPASKTPAAPNKSPVRPDEMSPAVRRIVEENKLDPAAIPASGPGGRLTKEDVQKYLDSRSGAKAPAPAGRQTDDDDTDDADGNGAPAPRRTGGQFAAAPPASHPAPAAVPASAASKAPGPTEFDASGVKRVPMSKIRKKIAERLVQAQQTAAILTTFNEVDLFNLQEIRGRHKERFEKTHGIGLGLMSFFCRAVVLGLKEFPRLNAFIDGEDIVYHNHVHLGIAVSTDRGLAVPVMRHAEQMSFARIESEIKRLAGATREGKLGLEELSGGTFTITNGGVFGSLLSTPILNPPQSGILGMHTIKQRPMVVDGKVEVRPMMYLALSYDHRLVDGRESVSFLVRVKELLEDPTRLMLEI